MQDILEELLASTSYLDPYLRQFFKYLHNKKVLTIGEKGDFLANKIKNMGFDVDNLGFINKEIKKTFSGIILFNGLNDIEKNNIPLLFDDILNILEDDGYILLIISNKSYAKEYLDVVMGENYLFTEELSSYENLKFYIYAKNTIK